MIEAILIGLGMLIIARVWYETRIK